jgi:hypothetical protein
VIVANKADAWLHCCSRCRRERVDRHRRTHRGRHRRNARIGAAITPRCSTVAPFTRCTRRPHRGRCVPRTERALQRQVALYQVDVRRAVEKFWNELETRAPDGVQILAGSMPASAATRSSAAEARRLGARDRREPVGVVPHEQFAGQRCAAVRAHVMITPPASHVSKDKRHAASKAGQQGLMLARARGREAQDHGQPSPGFIATECGLVRRREARALAHGADAALRHG